MAVFFRSQKPKLQTLAATAAWQATVQETAAAITTSMSWVLRQGVLTQMEMFCQSTWLLEKDS